MEELKYLGSKDPLSVLKKWMEEAQGHSHIKEPTAVTFSTVDSNQKPYCRIVLAKEITKKGIVFYTNTKSQKGVQLHLNSCCSCHFYWDPLFRQVSIRGQAEKISRQDTVNYWDTRSRLSQLSQWVSIQSSEVESRDVLEKAVRQAEEKFKNQSIPCPEHWSGYHVIIKDIEFWIGRDHRLHDRFLFSRNEEEDRWNVKRLSP